MNPSQTTKQMTTVADPRFSVQKALAELERRGREEPPSEEKVRYDRWLTAVMGTIQRANAAVGLLFHAEFGQDSRDRQTEICLDPPEDGFDGSVHRRDILDGKVVDERVFWFVSLGDRVNFLEVSA